MVRGVTSRGVPSSAPTANGRSYFLEICPAPSAGAFIWTWSRSPPASTSGASGPRRRSPTSCGQALYQPPVAREKITAAASPLSRPRREAPTPPALMPRKSWWRPQEASPCRPDRSFTQAGACPPTPRPLRQRVCPPLPGIHAATGKTHLLSARGLPCIEPLTCRLHHPQRSKSHADASYKWKPSLRPPQPQPVLAPRHRFAKRGPRASSGVFTSPFSPSRQNRQNAESFRSVFGWLPRFQQHVGVVHVPKSSLPPVEPLRIPRRSFIGPASAELLAWFGGSCTTRLCPAS